MTNLWHNLDYLKEEKKIPANILKDQSDFLSEATQGLLYIDTQAYNEVDTKYMDDFDFGYKYILKSNVLSNYGYRILEIQHNTNLYPLKFTINDDILNEMKVSNPLITKISNEIKNEKDFISVISDTLNSKSVKEAIHTLYSISKSQII